MEAQTLVIADAPAWAASQGYNIHPIQDGNYTVVFGSTPIGALIPTAGGYKFATEVSEPEPDHEYEANSSSEFVSQSFGLTGFKPFEGTQFTKGTNDLVLGPGASGTGQQEHVSDCNFWLPYAAEKYCLSRDIRDYVLVPIPAIFSDLPNTNGDSLSLGQMLQFSTADGMQMYKTFKGKGTYLEHSNGDPTKAKGVILESFLRPVPFNTKYYKIVLLLAYDRTKDSELAGQILTRQTNAYSVGFHYSSYSCSICKTRVGKGINLKPCTHTQLGRPTYKQPDGKLVYRHCENGKGFECSSVRTPAFVSAIGPHVYDVRKF